MNWIGLIAALTAFLSIWAGHVAVRKIEAESQTIWIPTVIAMLFGVSAEAVSISIVNRPLSTVFGIIGTTLLWDAFEFTRQQKRIIKGHAPANPNNPRHAKILAKYSSATIHNLLNREPVGRLVSHDEAIKLIAGH